MPSDKYNEKAQRLDVSVAREHAALAVVRHAVAETPGVERLLAGRIKKQPVRIYDINGSPLFFDFPIKVRGGEGGVIRTAASRVLGTPVLALELGERHWSFSRAVEQLWPKVRRGRRGIEIPRPKLVCYSYPKLGVMFEVPDARGRTSREIFDVASLTPVRNFPTRGEREGEFAWSYYDSLDDRKRSRSVRAFDKLDVMRVKQPTRFRSNLKRVDELDRLVAIAKLKFKLFHSQKLEFCPHYGTEHARSHHCFVLHGQEVNDYCAVATCQMILCYYRYFYDQDDIAPSLSYSSGGGCPSNQAPGYQSLSNNHIIATFDTSATWTEARAQLDLLQPMKSGVPGHARAAAGYSYVQTLWPSTISERKLLIYDPWPWNSDYALAGSVYWEDWDAVTHTNFVYTELDY